MHYGKGASQKEAELEPQVQAKKADAGPYHSLSFILPALFEELLQLWMASCG